MKEAFSSAARSSLVDSTSSCSRRDDACTCRLDTLSNVLLRQVRKGVWVRVEGTKDVGDGPGWEADESGREGRKRVTTCLDALIASTAVRGD